MTFELSPEHLGVRDRAHTFAESVSTRATDLDRSGVVPEEIASEMIQLTSGDSLSAVIAVEEVAAVSAAVAAAAAMRPGGQSLALTGLRGAREIEHSTRAQLVLAAVALGIGRAALKAALEELKASKGVAESDVEKPHWAVADVATDLEAARLLVYKAARTGAAADVAVGRLMASEAAGRTVEAALRVVGPRALEVGSPTERLARDVRAVALIAGTEEDQRAVAAEGLLPR